MRKTTIGIGENKAADQLRGNRKADQRLCFRYMDSMRYSRKVPGLIHFKGYLTSNHYEVVRITNHIHFLYFSDKLRKEYARIILQCRLTCGTYKATEHFEKPLNQIF